MLVSDTRSGIQVAAAEGSAQQADFALAGALFGGGGGRSLGGYSNTNKGKVIAASFVDNWNNIVRAIRNNPSLVQARAGAASQADAAASVPDRRGGGGRRHGCQSRSQGAEGQQDGAPEVQTLTKMDEVLLLSKRGTATSRSPPRAATAG
jgi:hypothetical protein